MFYKVKFMVRFDIQCVMKCVSASTRSLNLHLMLFIGDHSTSSPGRLVVTTCGYYLMVLQRSTQEGGKKTYCTWPRQLSSLLITNGLRSVCYQCMRRVMHCGRESRQPSWATTPKRENKTRANPVYITDCLFELILLHYCSRDMQRCHNS